MKFGKTFLLYLESVHNFRGYWGTEHVPLMKFDRSFSEWYSRILRYSVLNRQKSIDTHVAYVIAFSIFHYAESGCDK
jgi:hypothetical protein